MPKITTKDDKSPITSTVWNTPSYRHLNGLVPPIKLLNTPINQSKMSTPLDNTQKHTVSVTKPRSHSDGDELLFTTTPLMNAYHFHQSEDEQKDCCILL
ncbi:hypothetical protein [Piscirickettsia salmonis]|uniref:hypothetical protein n=1 Tax=Piscirickettsia salmonis TaxID=1238 RepID=UPI0007C8AD72|nr:hypothetical protein A0O36_01673 [Piscirickettsiaceae bacterium NZ-RLO1]